MTEFEKKLIAVLGGIKAELSEITFFTFLIMLVFIFKGCG